LNQPPLRLGRRQARRRSAEVTHQQVDLLGGIELISGGRLHRRKR
jgi:hypothetical protein